MGRVEGLGGEQAPSWTLLIKLPYQMVPGEVSHTCQSHFVLVAQNNELGEYLSFSEIAICFVP